MSRTFNVIRHIPSFHHHPRANYFCVFFSLFTDSMLQNRNEFPTVISPYTLLHTHIHTHTHIHFCGIIEPLIHNVSLLFNEIRKKVGLLFHVNRTHTHTHTHTPQTYTHKHCTNIHIHTAQTWQHVLIICVELDRASFRC